MSAAACAAKIRLDGGRAIAGAKAFIQQVEDALKATFPPEDEQESGFFDLTTEQQKKLEALSSKWCKWGDSNFKWGDDTFKESSAVLTEGSGDY